MGHTDNEVQSALKRNVTVAYAAIWINIEGIMLCEIN